MRGRYVLLGILLLSQSAAAQQLVVDANSAVVRQGSAPLLRYRYRDVPFKPYVKELYTPSGVNVLLDAPPDHQHHHGLMFACAVNNVDFWGEALNSSEGHFEPTPGKESPMGGLDAVQTGGPEWYRVARFGQFLSWDPGARTRGPLSEHRTLTVGQMGKPKATVVTWASHLWTPEDANGVVLNGSHYHGLGLRFVRSMDGTGEFRNANNDPGVIFRGEERLSRAKWCAYTAQAEGKTVTVAMFDHPENPRYPATWFTMAKPFAYMSATWRLHEEPLKLARGDRLKFRYAVVLWDGRPETDQIENLYVQWVGMVGWRGAGLEFLLGL